MHCLLRDEFLTVGNWFCKRRLPKNLCSDLEVKMTTPLYKRTYFKWVLIGGMIVVFMLSVLVAQLGLYLSLPSEGYAGICAYKTDSGDSVSYIIVKGKIDGEGVNQRYLYVQDNGTIDHDNPNTCYMAIKTTNIPTFNPLTIPQMIYGFGNYSHNAAGDVLFHLWDTYYNYDREFILPEKG